MDKSTAVILIVLALAVFALSYYQASTYNAFGDHKAGELKIHHACFDVFDLDRVKESLTTDVLICEQVMLLWDIRDKIVGSSNTEFEQVTLFLKT